MKRFTLGTAAVLLSLTAAAVQAQDSTRADSAPTPLAFEATEWYGRLKMLAMMNDSPAQQRAIILVRSFNVYKPECEGGVAVACHHLAGMILDVGKRTKIDAADWREYQRSAADVFQRACDLGSSNSCGEAANLRRRLGSDS